MPAFSAEVKASDPSVASPEVVVWRTRRLVAVMLLAGLVLVGLTLVASQANPNAIDIGATLWIQQFKNPAFAALMYWVSWFGFAPQSWAMPLVVAAPFALRGLWVEAVWVLGSQAASVLTVLVKGFVHRARPSPELVGVIQTLNDPSFPSGHTVEYTTVFGAAFFLVYVLMHRSHLRTGLLILLALPIALVGPSRLYLGQHWLSDVVGGYAFAILFLVPYCWAYARWRLGGARHRFSSVVAA